MTPSFWLWLTLCVMALGAAAILATSKRRTEDEETDGVLHGIVPVIAATSYFAMACGAGALEISFAEDPSIVRDFYFARYIDWALTTPILLWALSTTAMHSGHRRKGAVFGLVAADVLMVVTAFFFGFATTPWIKWTWYAISCGAFVAVYYVIWVPLRQENRREREDVQAAFTRKASILSVVWFLYPLVLAAGTDGLQLLSATLTTLLIAVLDVTAKVIYGWMAVKMRAAVVERDLREGVRGPGPTDAPARAGIPAR